MQHIIDPPNVPPLQDGARVGGWWHEADNGRIVCDLCPRECHLKDGDRGFCFVRENRQGQLVLSTYGRSTGFCIDPIEKKPLNHFYPGTSVLSFGTAGCNLGCKFCQNWDISKSRETARLSDQASPAAIARAARELGCRSVAFTYNDPIIWAEYAIDTAIACHELDIRTVAVTAGYITPVARPAFFQHIDAANVDLKAFTEDFYSHITYSHLQPVLETIEWLAQETDVWIELTNLVIPTENDSPDEIRQMCDWILQHAGPDVPVHFTAFHPDFRMLDHAATPAETLIAARRIALEQGLNYVYVGNVHDIEHQSTWCPSCKTLLIERDWYELGQYHLRDNRCAACGHVIAGHFAERPGQWGQRRQPVRIADYERQAAANRAATSEPHAVPRESHTASSRSSTEAPSDDPESDPPPATTSADRSPQTVNPSPAGPSPSRPTAARQLSNEQRQQLFDVTCRLMARAAGVELDATQPVDLSEFADVIVDGAFVTAKIDRRLRGCMGRLGCPMPLPEAAEDAAARTVLHDPRFPAITRAELPRLHVDVTLLHSFEELPPSADARFAAVEIGRHGLQIRRGSQGGLLLPEVAVEHRMSAEQFLEAVCRKAGLPAHAWQDPHATLLRFEGSAVSGQFPAELAGPRPCTAAFTSDELRGLADASRRNILALRAGATTSVYNPSLPDREVSGLVLTLRHGRNEQHLQRIELGHDIPLQSSLFQLCQQAAATRSGTERGELEVDVSVLTDRVDHGLHGSARDIPDNQLGPAVLVLRSQNNRVLENAWAFDASRSPVELIADRLQAMAIQPDEQLRVVSFHVASTRSRLLMTNRLESRAAQSSAPHTVRPPAVAGLFYPDDPRELSRLVDRLLDSTGPARPTRLPAIMLPHAGLVYSGEVAAATIQRAEIPPRVIIIGPKHTPHGRNWAVAPQSAWQTPLGELPADPALARELVNRIPGLELDTAAHAREHAIEVELPFLQKLAPQSHVTGIVIGRASLEECRMFAGHLAEVLSESTQPWLLVISSDMNHFADDRTNRQLDELALSAMETLSAEHLLETVRAHQISMCGVLPAVIVMETLRRLDSLNCVERTAYATSADAGADPGRVVGYAGMLLS